MSVKPKDDGDMKTASIVIWINRASEMCNRLEDQARRSTLLRQYPLGQVNSVSKEWCRASIACLAFLADAPGSSARKGPRLGLDRIANVDCARVVQGFLQRPNWENAVATASVQRCRAEHRPMLSQFDDPPGS
jgi:hypothetical protein